jgi:outer membrane lipoprotein carrier protein
LSSAGQPRGRGSFGARLRVALLGLCAVLAGGLLSVSVASDTPSAGSEPALWALLAAQEQASGRFVQEMHSEEGDLIERSSGRYAVLRPGYFRWEIESPDRQQIFVAGDELWHYDVDLATASRRDTGGGSDFTPLELLGGDTASLRERFSVEQLDEAVFRLIPNYPQAGFSSVELTWSAGEIVAMKIRDRSGQAIQLALTPELGNTPLVPDDFFFEPPEGVDVFHNREF